MNYILDLTKSKKAYGAHSKSVLKSQIVGVPSVPNPFCFTPRVFAEYLETDTFTKEFLEEFKKVYKSVTVNNYSANIRTPDIECTEYPHLSYTVSNSYNIKSFDDFLTAFKDRFKKIKETILKNDIKKVKVSGLLMSSYDSLRCGIVQTNDGHGNIRIEAAFGQNTNIISRTGIDADIYTLNPNGNQIISKHIGTKDKEYVFAKKGLEIVPIPKNRQQLQVFSDEQILKYGEYSKILDSTYGPQEFECAITTDGLQLVQELRDMDIIKKVKQSNGIEIIYPGDITGAIININSISELPQNSTDKIMIVNTLDLDLLTLLIFKFKPLGVILKVGTLTSHASTILREAKIPSYINQNINIPNKTIIHLKENGSYEIHN